MEYRTISHLFRQLQLVGFMAESEGCSPSFTATLIAKAARYATAYRLTGDYRA